MKLDWNILKSGKRVDLTDREIVLDRENYNEIKFVLINRGKPVGLESKYSEDSVSVTFPPDLEAGEYFVCVRGIVNETNMKKEKINIIFLILLPVYVSSKAVDGIVLTQYGQDRLAEFFPDKDQVLICADDNGDLIEKDIVDGVLKTVNLSQTLRDAEQKIADSVASVTVGDTLTLDSEQPASVQNIGTVKDLKLKFFIPRGKQGVQGERGESGPRGLQGPRGPQGIQGPEGEQGPQGASGVTAPSAGMFTLEMEPNGDLYAVYIDQEGGETPRFEYDKDVGNIYYIID